MMISVIAECLREEGFVVAESTDQLNPWLLISNQDGSKILQACIENEGIRIIQDDLTKWQILDIDNPNAFGIIAAEINRLFNLPDQGQQNYQPPLSEPDQSQILSNQPEPPM